MRRQLFTHPPPSPLYALIKVHGYFSKYIAGLMSSLNTVRRTYITAIRFCLLTNMADSITYDNEVSWNSFVCVKVLKICIALY